MLYLFRTVVFPDVSPLPEGGGGGFQPGSFQHLMHLRIQLPGLDPAWEHTLVNAVVAPDGASAELTVQTSAPPHVSLDRSLRIVTWQPAAHVKAHDAEGNELAAVRLDAPLHAGQHVELGGVRYRVAPDPSWPHRDPDSGMCTDSLDWQHVTLIPDPLPAALPTHAAGDPHGSQDRPETTHPDRGSMV